MYVTNVYPKFGFLMVQGVVTGHLSLLSSRSGVKTFIEIYLWVVIINATFTNTTISKPLCHTDIYDTYMYLTQHDSYAIWRRKKYNNHRCVPSHGSSLAQELFCMYSTTLSRTNIWHQRLVLEKVQIVHSDLCCQKRLQLWCTRFHYLL